MNHTGHIVGGIIAGGTVCFIASVTGDIELGWDGKIDYSDDIFENGIYMYHVYVTDYNDKPWVYNGELNLMK